MASRLSDSMSMEEWQKQRNSDAGLPVNPPPARVRMEGPVADAVERQAARERAHQPSARPPAASAPQQIDSQRTVVFREGPDGKLHPVTGWHTTGPLDFDTWRRNIDWDGVRDDFVKLGERTVGALAPLGPFGLKSPFPRAGMERAGTGFVLYDMAKELGDDLSKTQEPPKRR